MKITGINRIDAQPRTAGRRLIANFDCVIAGVVILRCNLIEDSEKRVFATPPNLPHPTHGRIIRFREETGVALAKSAMAALARLEAENADAA